MDVFVMLAICIASLTIWRVLATSFDVMQYGAIGDGKTDDVKAFLQAWQDFCSDDNNPILNIPEGKTFLLGPLNFQGPCKSSTVYIKALGNIVAPVDASAWSGCVKNSWIVFSGVNGLTIDGSGQIDGQGSFWWNNTIATQSCGGKPTALRFSKCNDMKLSGLNHINPPKHHITIDYSNNVTITNLTITAPQFSPNTDGILIVSSTNFHLQDLNIQTGDDCIAVNNGSSYINISRVACGPGHGISIGSLGEGGSYAMVEHVFVQHCSFTGTTNGCRIKTWPGGHGYARNISFNQITLNGVKNPIIIDQNYCDTNGIESSCKDVESAVEVSNVEYKYVQGSSATKLGIILDCNGHVGCTNITMEHVDISGDGVSATCKNAHGTAIDTSPQVPCLEEST